MKVLSLAEHLIWLAKQPTGAFRGPEEVLELSARAEEYYFLNPRLLTEDPVALIKGENGTAWRSPSVQTIIERWRRAIADDPPRGFWILGRQLNAFLDALRPPARPRGRRAPRTTAMAFHDRILISLAEQYEAAIQEALKLGRMQGREGKPLDVISVNRPSLPLAEGDEFFRDGMNWYATKVPLFHETLAALTERALRGEKGTPAQLAAAWMFKYETGEEKVKVGAAVAWLKRIKDRARWEARPPRSN